MEIVDIIKLASQGIKYNEAVSLVKAGYTVENINELINMDKSEESKEKSDADKHQEEQTSNSEHADEHDKPETKENSKDNSVEKSSKDDEIKELKNQVKTLQDSAINKDISNKNKENEQEELNDLFRSFM